MGNLGKTPFEPIRVCGGKSLERVHGHTGLRVVWDKPETEV